MHASPSRLICRLGLAFALSLAPLNAPTGDTLQNSPFTRQALQTILERLGVQTRGANVNTKDIAAVMVTANLPPFAAQGSKVDVIISVMGDAKSLQGGTLLATLLLAADGEVYALAQGAAGRRRLLGAGPRARRSAAACRPRAGSQTAARSSAKSASGSRTQHP